MILVPFEAGHLAALDLQSAQTDMQSVLSNPDYGAMLESVHGWTLLHGDRIMGCGGMVDMGQGRALCWALVSAHCRGFRMVSATRHVRERLAAAPFRRLEAIVADGFEEGARWAALLGFFCETPFGMRGWFPDGSNAFLWAKTR